MNEDNFGNRRRFLGATREEWTRCRRILIVLFAVALLAGLVKQYSGWV